LSSGGARQMRAACGGGIHACAPRFVLTSRQEEYGWIPIFVATCLYHGSVRSYPDWRYHHERFRRPASDGSPVWQIPGGIPAGANSGHPPIWPMCWGVACAPRSEASPCGYRSAGLSHARGHHPYTAEGHKALPPHSCHVTVPFPAAGPAVRRSPITPSPTRNPTLLQGR